MIGLASRAISAKIALVEHASPTRRTIEGLMRVGPRELVTLATAPADRLVFAS